MNNNTMIVQDSVKKMMSESQKLKDEISSIKHKDMSINYYLGNLKRLSLQALDLFSAMEKQIAFLNNQENFIKLKNKAR